MKKSECICTDQWVSYKCLKDEGYLHETVNHSTNCVAPSKKKSKKKKRKRETTKNNQEKCQISRNYKFIQGHTINTETIESRWRFLKQRLRLRSEEIQIYFYKL
ncbi:hypothetical protein ABPG72_010710 [Tetrahymena utriculariae]